MKNLLFFITALRILTSLNSCSSDNDSGQSLSFKINGIEKNFKVTSSIASGNAILVYGYIGNLDQPTENLSFSMQIGDTNNPIYDFRYTDANGHQNTATNIVSGATVNTANYAVGTFSGTIQLTSESSIHTITEGNFSIRPNAG